MILSAMYWIYFAGFVVSVQFCAVDCFTKSQALEYLENFGYYGNESPLLQMQQLSRINSPLAFENALKEFQRRFKLSVTGRLDFATQSVMNLKRCGVKDITSLSDLSEYDDSDKSHATIRSPFGVFNRKKRYAVKGRRWPNDEISYSVDRYTNDLPQSIVDAEIVKAFSLWSAATPLTFVKLIDRRPDINISFVVADHGDGFPFNGRGGTLAHAWFPMFQTREIEGDAHFDDDEPWSSNSIFGVNFFYVAAHEFGHSLGLGHSTETNSLMYPIYRGFVENLSLHTDDIAGIQALYGAPIETPSTTTTTTATTTTTSTTTTPRSFTFIPPKTPTPATTTTTSTSAPTTTTPTATTSTTTTTPATTLPTTTTTWVKHTDASTSTTHTPGSGPIDFCHNSKIDAITSHRENGNLHNYIFRGEWYAEINDDGLVAGYPRRISDDWPALPANIDAALFLPRYKNVPEYTLFFKGARLFVFSENKHLVRKNNRNFRPMGSLGLPPDIDSAFIWGPLRRIYVTKGNRFYGLRRHSQYLLKKRSAYPRPLWYWNLPEMSIDAALKYKEDDYTFLFNGDHYYKIHDKTKTVLAAQPAYPRQSADWFFGCENGRTEHTIREHVPQDDNNAI